MKLRRALLIIACVVFCIFILTEISRAELPEYISEQLHKGIKYDVITGKNLNTLEKYKPGTKPVHFLAVQVPPELFKEEHAKILLDWVNSGGVIWFYDSRLASYFGMESAPYEKKRIRGKDYEGGYAAKKVKGMNVVVAVHPFAESDVVSGVQSIQVFLMEVDKDKYSAVSIKTPGVVGLFVANEENKCAVALRKLGKGWIVFKPLLWPKVLGGERFQVNLKEFSAGYPVPKSDKPLIPSDFYKGRPVKLKRYDSLKLANGEQCVGMVKAKEFSFLGGQESVEVGVDKIELIEVSMTGDKLKLRDGNEYIGNLMTLSIELKSTTGKKIKLSKEDIQSIHFDVGEK
ncbi:MAG: hypothetical protein K8T10_14825 [Candidatus Eremiobacteraeota bacterium]|nr:hypothetical protein [Candidatus Eremiobacteraeota bacterium]